MRWSNKIKTGFTLAEILITIGIIGIVAAMTIPTLQANIRDKQFRSKFLKTYSQIQQVMKKMEADDIPLNGVVYDRGGDPFYLKVHKYLVNSVYMGRKYFSSYYNLTGSSTVDSLYFDDGQILLPDGTLLIFEQPASSNGHTWIFVDVNGKKQPNKLGHDLFCLQLTDEGMLIPMGHVKSSFPENQYCVKGDSGYWNGMGCATKLINEPKYFEWLRK